MANQNIHTVPTDEGWANRQEGSSSSFSTHATKAEAVDAGRDRARTDKVEHLVHNKDGSIGSRNSYGNDPRRSPG